jgi:EmrB/QacA subfamily drug resistance transporter
MIAEEEHPYKWFSLIGLSLLAFTAFLDFTIVNTAIPFIQETFRSNIVDLQWINTIFLMIQSMSMIAVGKLGYIWNRRLLFYLGFVIFAIAAIGAALSPSLLVLIIFRAIQGFSGAIIFTQSAVLLPQAFPKDQQSVAISVYSAFTGLGLAVGPFLGGIIIHYLDWRYVFWVNIPIIIIGFAFCLFTLKPSPKGVRPPKFDFIGLVLLIISVWGIVFGTVYWGTWVYLIIGIVALILLIIQELRHPHPLVDLRTFTNPYALMGVLICLSAAIYSCVYIFFDPIYFKVILGYNPALIGIVLIAMPISQVLVSALFPKLMKNFGIIKILVGCALLGIIGAILNTFFAYFTNIWYVVLTLLCMGFVWGAANAGSISVVSCHMPEESAGSVLGTIFTTWNITGAIFLAVSSVIFHNAQFSHLSSFIAKHKGEISKTMQQHLDKAVYDPDHAVQILHQHQGSSKLYQIFSDGFLYALHYMSTFLVILAVIIFIGMLFVWIRLRPDSQS